MRRRSYTEVGERLAGIRGRIDLPAQRRLVGLPLPTECRFDDYSADVPLNRILRSAAVRLLRLPGVTIPPGRHCSGSRPGSRKPDRVPRRTRGRRPCSRG